MLRGGELMVLALLVPGVAGSWKAQCRCRRGHRRSPRALFIHRHPLGKTQIDLSPCPLGSQRVGGAAGTGSDSAGGSGLGTGVAAVLRASGRVGHPSSRHSALTRDVAMLLRPLSFSNPAGQASPSHLTGERLRLGEGPTS